MITQEKLYNRSGSFRLTYIGTTEERNAVPEGNWEYKRGDIWFDTTESIFVYYTGTVWSGMPNGMLVGDDTHWKDIATSLIGRRLYNNVGTVDYDFDENSVRFAKNGSLSSESNRIGWNIQLQHDTLAGEGSVLRTHLHLWQEAVDEDVVFELQYRIQKNGEAKTADWSDVLEARFSDGVFTYTSGSLNQIIKFEDIDISDAPLSSVVQFQMTRTDNESTSPTHVHTTFIDSHYQVDGVGSRQEFIK